MREITASRGLAPLARAPVAIRPRRSETVSITLWLPLTPLLLLAAPLVLLLAPLARLNRTTRRIPPFRLAWALGGLLTSLSGTRIEIDAPGAHVRLRIF
jgi:hypothetical protein